MAATATAFERIQQRSKKLVETVIPERKFDRQRNRFLRFRFDESAGSRQSRYVEGYWRYRPYRRVILTGGTRAERIPLMRARVKASLARNTRFYVHDAHVANMLQHAELAEFVIAELVGRTRTPAARQFKEKLLRLYEAIPPFTTASFVQELRRKSARSARRRKTLMEQVGIKKTAENKKVIYALFDRILEIGRTSVEPEYRSTQEGHLVTHTLGGLRCLLAALKLEARTIRQTA